METVEQARETIYKEIAYDDPDIRADYMKLFEPDVKEFAGAMSHAFIAWRSLDTEIANDEKGGYVSALVYAALTLHIISFELFLSGHIVAAGNAFRQVVESIGLALLCAGKDLGVLERFMEGKYSTNDAVRDVLRQGEKLALKKEALDALRSSQEFYHKYSHISRLTLWTLISNSEEGTYVGASFDKGKVEAYRKEVTSRVGLAMVFANFVEAVRANVAKW